jgi:hypothetical protein
VQARIGEGRLEDSRAPRLANAIGTLFPGGASLAWWLGAPVVGGRIDPDDLDGFAGADMAFVEFIHPLCAECREWERRLASEDAPLLTVDVRDRPDLAHKYGIAIVPTVLAVGAEGSVIERLAP